MRIPNMDGIHHRVRSGESLSSISKTYGIDMTAVVDANDLASATISSGQTLFVPKARLASATLREFYGERFIWPARGRISSPYGYRIHPFTGLRSFHSAIDIVLPTGTRVKATAEGRVGDTGYNSVFGNYVILRHANGYQSLYAHLNSISVKVGSYLDQGATVGLSGNSGQSTGPHLHFSLFKNGQALNPAKYVK
ncbi:MAG: LysM domain/M23/M37 peptidase domain-containing protein [Spirochaetes bacterium]|nr:MAG: LysM domain/M23/M37 peptidase domain-containing protein [Spirochaetota bacterium]